MGTIGSAGVDLSVYDGIEGDHRVVLLQSQRRMCLAARVLDARKRAMRQASVDAVVQPGAPASDIGVSEPHPLSAQQFAQVA